jgi:hypothetical protein
VRFALSLFLWFLIPYFFLFCHFFFEHFFASCIFVFKCLKLILIDYGVRKLLMFCIILLLLFPIGIFEFSLASHHKLHMTFLKNIWMIHHRIIQNTFFISLDLWKHIQKTMWLITCFIEQMKGISMIIFGLLLTFYLRRFIRFNFFLFSIF